MTRIITGNFWRDGDPKEVVVATWDSLEKWLQEKYGAHFSDTEHNVREIYNNIERYGGLENTRENESRILESITQDIQRSRADFLRKIEKFGYHFIDDDRNLDGVSLARKVSIDSIEIPYTKDDKWDSIQLLVWPARPLFLGSSTFYTGNNYPLYKSEKRRSERFLDRATNPSSIVVAINGLGEAGSSYLKQFYKQTRKNTKTNFGTLPTTND